jgi:hypothetical protein
LTAINERAGTLLGLLPVIAGKAEIVVEQVTKGQ